MQGMFHRSVTLDTSRLTQTCPPESTYTGGVLLLYVTKCKGYPMSPPKPRLVTLVYHPNINRRDRICHSIFGRDWTVDTTIKDLFDTIYSLLLVPELSDPIKTIATLSAISASTQLRLLHNYFVHNYWRNLQAEGRRGDACGSLCGTRSTQQR